MIEIETLEFTKTLGETICFSDPLFPDAMIEVHIVEIRGDQIKLGITAPKTMSVHRREIWEQVQQVGQKLEERAFD